MINLFSFIRRHLWATISIIAILVLGLGIYVLTRPSRPTYLTAGALRGDLKQTVTAVGTIVSERDLDLQFAGTDIVRQVYVKEGDHVVAGQKLASLRAGMISASVQSASAGVQSAYAALQALQEGSRPEDIQIAQATLDNQKASLSAAEQSLKNAEANLKVEQDKYKTIEQEAAVNLSGEVEASSSVIAQHLASAKTSLRTVQGVFNQNDIQDVVIRNGSIEYTQLSSQMQTTLSAIDALMISTMNPMNYQAALKNLSDARTQVAQAAAITDNAYDIVSTLPPIGFFTETKREGYKTTLATQRTAIQAALTGLDSTIKGIRDLSASYDSRLATEQSTIASIQGARDKAQADIVTFETAVQIGQAQLNLKKAPARRTDIDAAVARLRQAQAALAQASSQYHDTILTAPVDGIITKVNAKVGEIRPMSQPSVTMLGNSPLRVEMYVSEVDIPKIKYSQSGSIKLDAFRDTDYKLRVSEIDPAPTNVDGVDKFRVRLDFRYLHDEFRIGMSGDVTIITGERKNVIQIPSRAIIQDDSGKDVVRVLSKNGKTVTTKTVVPGMEGEGGDTEILNGISEGDNVITLTKK